MITERALIRLVRAYAKLSRKKKTSYAPTVKILLRAYGADMLKAGVPEEQAAAALRKFIPRMEREYGSSDREFSLTPDEVERWAGEGFPPEMPTV